MAEKLKILIVDDNPVNAEILEIMLSNFEVTSNKFTDPVEAYEYIKSNHVDIAFLDYMMPEMNGIELMKKIRFFHHDAIIVMITTHDQKEIKLEALKAGASDFLSKPIDKAEFIARTQNLINMKNDQILLKNNALLLEMEVIKATAKIFEREKETIEYLGRASELRDMQTGKHIRRVGLYSRLIAEKIGKNEMFQDIILNSAQLHDVGKIGIPDHILLKPGKLTFEEFEIVKTHSKIGFELLKNANGKYLRAGALVAISHHERYDGTGYPYGIKGDKINIFGRITAIADVFDALVMKRPYKEAWKPEAAFEEINNNAGKSFDPVIVDAFIKAKDEFLKIYIDNSDL